MKSLATMSRQSAKRVLGIDPSSHSMAFACMDDYDGLKILRAGKITFNKGDTQSEKMKKVQAGLNLLLDDLKPDKVLVEETVYLQNPNTTRVLAYQVGNIMGTVLAAGYEISDIAPLKWKPAIGYKKIMPKDIKAWAEEIGEKEAKKKAAFERKNRVKEIMKEKINTDTEDWDYDVWDAVAIAYYGMKHG